MFFQSLSLRENLRGVRAPVAVSTLTGLCTCRTPAPPAVTPRGSLPSGPGSPPALRPGSPSGPLPACLPPFTVCVSGSVGVAAGQCPSGWVHGCLPVTCRWTLWFFPHFGSCEQSCCGHSWARVCEDACFPCSGQSLLLVAKVSGSHFLPPSPRTVNRHVNLKLPNRRAFTATGLTGSSRRWRCSCRPR